MSPTSKPSVPRQLCPQFPLFKNLDTKRLRLSGFHVVSNSSGGQEEQSNKCAFSNLGVVMCAWRWRCPTCTLPPLHSLQFCRLVELYDAVDFSIWMDVVLAVRFHDLAFVLFCEGIFADIYVGRRN